MIAQGGFFSACRNVLGDHDEILGEVFDRPSQKETFRRLVIPASLKVTFARKLRSMNISANALFPGLDGLARSVTELVQLS